MHDALTTPELLLFIFKSDDLTAKDLCQAALVCWNWAHWASDVIWEEYDVPFCSVVELLGQLTPVIRSHNTYYSWDIRFDDVSEQQWHRFLRHTQWITHLKLDGFALDPPVVYLLERLRLTYGGTIFPALRAIELRTSRNMSLTTSLLMVPTMTIVRLTCGSRKAQLATEKIVRMLRDTLSQGEATELTLKLDDVADPRLFCFPRLEYLSLEIVRPGKTLPAELFQLLQSLKSLTSLHIITHSGWTAPDLMEEIELASLHRLRLSGPEMTGFVIHHISAPVLEELSLKRLSSPLQLPDDELDIWIRKCDGKFPKLSRLSIGGRRTFRAPGLQGIVSFPAIRHLTVSGEKIEVRNFQWLVGLTASRSKLETLRFRCRKYSNKKGPVNMDVTPSALLDLLKQCPCLRELSLGLSDLQIETTGDTFPLLEALEFSIPSGEGVGAWGLFAFRLTKSLPGLKKLNVMTRRLSDEQEDEEDEEGKKAIAIFWTCHDEHWKTQSPE